MKEDPLTVPKEALHNKIDPLSVPGRIIDPLLDVPNPIDQTHADHLLAKIWVQGPLPCPQKSDEQSLLETPHLLLKNHLVSKTTETSDLQKNKKLANAPLILETNKGYALEMKTVGAKNGPLNPEL